MRADELGRRKPSTLFYDRALSISKLRYHQTIDQKTSVRTQKIFKPTLHSLGRFLGKSLNFREFKTFTNRREPQPFPPFSLS
jgi:hypothetical protein